VTIDINGLQVQREGRVILDIPRLQIPSGAVTAVLGANGAGKTTLLRVIAGLEHPSAGTVHIDGAAPSVGKIGMVFQRPVLLRRTVKDNLDLALRLRKVPSADRQQRVHEALSLLDVLHLADRSAVNLSDGEARRVDLARALALRDSVLLLDEPFVGLDSATYNRLVADFPRLLSLYQPTTLLVTHSPQEARQVAQHVVRLSDGRVTATDALTP